MKVQKSHPLKMRQQKGGAAAKWLIFLNFFAIQILPASVHRQKSAHFFERPLWTSRHFVEKSEKLGRSTGFLIQKPPVVNVHVEGCFWFGVKNIYRWRRISWMWWAWILLIRHLVFPAGFWLGLIKCCGAFSPVTSANWSIHLGMWFQVKRLISSFPGQTVSVGDWNVSLFLDMFEEVDGRNPPVEIYITL